MTICKQKNRNNLGYFVTKHQAETEKIQLGGKGGHNRAIFDHFRLPSIQALLALKNDSLKIVFNIISVLMPSRSSQKSSDFNQNLPPLRGRTLCSKQRVLDFFEPYPDVAPKRNHLLIGTLHLSTLQSNDLKVLLKTIDRVTPERNHFPRAKHHLFQLYRR